MIRCDRSSRCIPAYARIKAEKGDEGASSLLSRVFLSISILDGRCQLYDLQVPTHILKNQARESSLELGYSPDTTCTDYTSRRQVLQPLVRQALLHGDSVPRILPLWGTSDLKVLSERCGYVFARMDNQVQFLLQQLCL